MSAIQQAITSLSICSLNFPPTYRSALEMRLINGYSGKEIAQHLGISESAVNTRISRGRALLREIAVKEGFHI